MNNYIKHIYIFSFFICCFYTSDCQIVIDNGSFEGIPADATMPAGWFAGSKGTTPDILPGYWGVYNEPEDGESYVGIITRQDGSYECLSQRVPSAMEAELCYSMSLFLAFSDNYTGYNTPIKLKIWIGSSKNAKEQLVFTSPTVKSEEWKKFLFEFIPDKDMYYIMFEAYNDDGDTAHKGNILIDKVSSIYLCNKA